MKESPLHSSLITRRRKENDVHQIQGSLLLEIQREGMIENHHTLDVSIVTRKVIMIEIALRRTMVHVATLETTITIMVIKEEMNEGLSQWKRWKNKKRCSK